MLSRPEARDPKLAGVQHFLTEHRTGGKTWLEYGCIIFSQYYDTACYIGAELVRALPEDKWIDSVEKLEEMMDQYVHLRQQAQDSFELRYKETIDPEANRWELGSRMLSHRDVIEKLSEAW